MCGSHAEQAVSGRWADFNAWCDPEALATVVAAGLPLTLIGLDVTRRVTVSRAEIAALSSARSALSRWLGDALRWYLDADHGIALSGACPVHDAVVVGAVLGPRLARYASRRIRIDLDEGERRGHTREAADGYPVTVATGIAAVEMRRVIDRVVSPQ
jgi:inosine-uridine nucleoside N-ribohydrolase